LFVMSQRVVGLAAEQADVPAGMPALARCVVLSAVQAAAPARTVMVTRAEDDKGHSGVGTPSTPTIPVAIPVTQCDAAAISVAIATDGGPRGGAGTVDLYVGLGAGFAA
jgi:hypothetical protein